MEAITVKWADGKPRCRWADPNNERYLRYHDQEWGVPVHDDQKLFEMLILESFQAGLSWACVLNKRDAFRQAFDDFDLDAVCAYKEDKLATLAQDPGIIRNRRKIQAAVNNAQVFREIQGAVSYTHLVLPSFLGFTSRLALSTRSWWETADWVSPSSWACLLYTSRCV